MVEQATELPEKERKVLEDAVAHPSFYQRFGRSALNFRRTLSPNDPAAKSPNVVRTIDVILLTGGGASLLSKVAATKLRDYAHIISTDPEPATSNVRGFHLLGEFLNGQMG